MKDKSVSSLEKDFCDCNFVMIMRDQKTQVPYCAECKKEVEEHPVSSPDKKVETETTEDRNIKEALAPKSEMSKRVDPQGYATAAVKILHALKLVIGQDVNEHAMPVLIQIMKNNIGNEPGTVLEQEELWNEAREKLIKFLAENEDKMLGMPTPMAFDITNFLKEQGFLITRKP